jgi:tetratricopeptide (TPR) repeat protein
VEPDWADALDAQFWFLITQGERAFSHTTLVEALGRFQAAETIVQHLLKVEPGATRSQHHLSVVLANLGDFLVARGQQGDAEKALGHFQRCNETLERLLRDNSQSGRAARDVSVSLDRLGDFLADRGQQGDAEKALAHYHRSNEILERLLRDNPQSGQAARDVSVSLDRLGGFLADRGQQGDAEKALAYFQRCNEIREGLLRDNPQTGQAVRDVSASLHTLGDFLASRGQQGEAEKALAHFRRSLELRECLLRDNPQSGLAARDAIVSCLKLGLFEYKTLYEPVRSIEFAMHLLAVVEKVFPEAVLTFDRFDLRTGIAEDTMLGREPPDREQWLARLPEVIHQIQYLRRPHAAAARCCVSLNW